MATITLNTAANNTEWSSFTVNMLLGEIGRLTIKTHSGATSTIDWGDGSIASGLVSGTEYSNTYLANTVIIKIKTTNGLEDIKEILNSLTAPVKFTGSLSEFKQFPLIDTLADFESLLTGTLLDIPSTLKILYIGSTTGADITGNIIDLPASLQQITLNTLTPLTGNISNFKASLTQFDLNNTLINGDIANMSPLIISFLLRSSGNIVGNIVNLPSSITAFSLEGDNTITGDVANFPLTLITVIIKGSNTLYGDAADMAFIPFVTIEGNNTIIGL